MSVSMKVIVTKRRNDYNDRLAQSYWASLYRHISDGHRFPHVNGLKRGCKKKKKKCLVIVYYIENKAGVVVNALPLLMKGAACLLTDHGNNYVPVIEICMWENYFFTDGSLFYNFLTFAFFIVSYRHMYFVSCVALFCWRNKTAALYRSDWCRD